MKRLLLAGGILAVALLTLLWLRLDGDSSSAAVARSEPEVDARDDAPSALVPVELARTDARASAAESPPSPAEIAAVTATPVVATEGSPLALAGTIVVVDEHGVEHRGEDGEFTLELWHGNSGEHHKVEVLDGTWSTELPQVRAIDALGLTGVRLRGRGGVPGEGCDGRIAMPTDGLLRLTARWPKATTLHVRDRASGRELAPVLLADVGGWPQSEFGHPGSTGSHAKDLGSSPVKLPEPIEFFGGPRAFHVRSPGYAWGRVEIDDSRGGERIVLLDPAGELEVVLVGQVQDKGTKLRLFGAEYAPVFESLVGTSSSFVVDGLPPGSHRVKVEIGEYFREPIVLAEDTAEVVAGTRTIVTLAMKDIGANVDVALSGTLDLPTAWEMDDFRLDFELLDTPRGGSDGRFSIERARMAVAKDEPGVYRWTAPRVQPGRYEVELHVLGFRALITVGDAGLDDARIVVPPPCEVLVRCIEEDTRTEITDAPVSWTCVVPQGVNAWSHESATWDAELRRWRIRAPQGQIVVAIFGAKYQHTTEVFEVRAGTNDVVIELALPTSLKVVLRDGTTEIPWGNGVYPELQSAAGQEEYSSYSSSSGNVTLHKKEAGRYRLVVPEIPGFEPVPVVEVELEKGRTKEHVVELVRKP